jgi:hypothetical protein
MPWPRERKCEAIRRGQQRSGNAASRKGASEQVAQASQRLSACRSRRTDADRLAVSATAPALLYLLHPCSRRRLFQTPFYLLHPCSRRQLLLRCPTSRIHAAFSRQCTKELRADRRCLTHSFSKKKVAFRRPPIAPRGPPRQPAFPSPRAQLAGRLNAMTFAPLAQRLPGRQCR